MTLGAQEAAAAAARPVILWFRRDLRLDDHLALQATLATGRPVIALFIHDETCEGLGAAARWRLGLSVAALARDLAAAGSALILRRGPAFAVLSGLIAETGATAVYWTRYYEPAHIARDTAVKSGLRAMGLIAESFPGALLFEPRTVQTGGGQPYSVFTPFWRAIRARDPGAPVGPPRRIPPPATLPASDDLADWRMGEAMGRGAAIVLPYQSPGGTAALARLDRFLDERLEAYAEARDLPGCDGTSGLSEHLAWGEVSPRRIWRALMAAAALRPGGERAAEKFLSELGWREFAWHLMAHHPQMASAPWRDGWQAFAWRPDNPDAEAWRRGQTGEDFVDAGLREMYVTGRMHNRLRMVVASYLTKHLLTDWRVGLAWFAECLTDWDPAANALGWQWVAGCGPDAAPYFRIFNPRLQAARFDPDGTYAGRFVGMNGNPAPLETAYHAAAPKSWGLTPGSRPAPLIAPEAGRARALDAYQALRTQMERNR